MAKRKLKGFLYSLGINAKDYPLASNLKTSFIDGSKKSITDRFYPYDCLLKEHDINNFMEFLDSVEKDLRNGIAFKIERVLSVFQHIS